MNTITRICNMNTSARKQVEIDRDRYGQNRWRLGEIGTDREMSEIARNLQKYR